MQTDLNRLRIFHVIFAANSVSRAARELNISQPAVSQHLKKLEKELHVRLFTRVHKKLVPTTAAHQLFATIDPFLKGLPKALDRISKPTDIPSGLLRLGAPYEFGQTYLPEICHIFREHYPEVRFLVKLGESFSLLEALQEGALDFAIIDLVLTSLHPLGEQRDQYNIDSLIDEEMALMCSREYYDRRIRGDHSYTNLIDKEFLSDEHDDTFLRHWFKHHFGKEARNLRIVMTVESHQAILHCMKMGMGMTVTSSHMVWREIQDDGIVPITTGTPNAINTISLVQLYDKIPTVTEKVFNRHIREYMRLDSIQHRFAALPETTDTGSRQP